MKLKTLEKIAKKFDTEIVWKKYKYWDRMPFIKNTCICFDVTPPGGGMAVYADIEGLPKFVTVEYIESAIVNDCENLGKILYIQNKWGSNYKMRYKKINE